MEGWDSKKDASSANEHYVAASTSLLATLWIVQRHALLRPILYFMVQSACAIAQPVIIYFLLTWVASAAPEARIGGAFVAGLAVCSAVGFAAENAFDVSARRAGLAARAAVTSMCFDKMLRLSIVDAQRTHSGEISALMSSELLALAELWHGIVALALQPVEIAVITALLSWIVGLATVGALVVVIAAVFLVQCGGRRLSRLAAARADITAARTRDVGEMLQGMRAVKLNAMERRFYDAIATSRRAESKLTRETRWSYGIINTSASNAVDVISLAVVAVLAFGLGAPIDPRTVFSYWVLLGLLHGRIFHLPVSLAACKHGLLALSRAQHFLSLPERKDARVLIVANSNADVQDMQDIRECTVASAVAPCATAARVVIRDGVFSWTGASHAATKGVVGDKGLDATVKSKESGMTDPAMVQHAATSAVLDAINIDVSAGSFFAVAGAVGTGKSSLLAAILGEITCVNGTVELHVAGRHPNSDAPMPCNAASDLVIAYVPAAPWIVPGTVRENIVMGRSWDAARYARVVAACALLPDFNTWPERDETHVASATLSGGQRQRVAIARAAYTDPPAAVYLFDDCLSALDQRVARHVLRECVLGVLSGTTRIVVASAPSVLAAADSIGLCFPTAFVATHPVEFGGDDDVTSSSERVLEVPDRESGVDAEEAFQALGRCGGPFTLRCGPPAVVLRNTVVRRLMRHLSTATGGGADAAAVLETDQADTAARGAMSSSPLCHVVDAAPVLPAVRVAPLQFAVDEDALSGSPTDSMTIAAPALQSDVGSSGTLPVVDGLRSDRKAPPMSGPSLILNLADADAPSWPSQPGAQQSLPHPPRLPFFASWVLGAGGPGYSASVVGLLLAEAAAVEAGVYWLAQWTGDAGYTTTSERTYFGIYALFVVLELAAAYSRQHVYVLGTTKAADTLHDDLVFKLTRAPQSFFDAHSASALADLCGRQLAAIDADTLYASEYFWLGLVYGLLIVLAEIVVTPWVLVPGAAVTGMLWYVLRGDAVNENLNGGVVMGSDDSRVMETAQRDDRQRGSPSGAPTAFAASARRLLSRFSLLRRHRKREATVGSSALLAMELRAKEALGAEFQSTTEGLPSVRAGGPAARLRVTAAHTALLDAHTVAWDALCAHEARTVLAGNLCGAFYYACSVLIVVPLRVMSDSGTATTSSLGGGAGGISAAGAGFLIVNSCFASYMATMVLQNAAVLRALAFRRGALVAAIMETPAEGAIANGAPAGLNSRLCTTDGDAAADAADAARVVAITRRMAWYYAAMKRPPPVSRPLSAVVISSDERVTASPPLGWPTSGTLSITNLRLRYRQPDGPLVLRGVDLEVAGGERIGIVGRTGAGKSSLLAALVRLVEPEPGSAIVLDGVNTASLPLATLRGRGVTVISQDALFFSASLKRNLDPFGLHADAELLAALDAVHLREYAERAARAAAVATVGSLQVADARISCLDAPIAERGSNLSSGQAQLLALARALLRRPRLLLLDEATAQLDAETEELVNHTVRAAFGGATILIVAHRLASVIDADRVVVLDEGRVVEQGRPADLLELDEGVFASMLAALPPAQQAALKAAATDAQRRAQ